MTPEEQQLIKQRQRSRSIITAIILVALVVLFYGITISKITGS